MSAVYAIVHTGGKQYRFEPGSSVDVELLEGAVGETISLDNVFAIRESDGNLVLGTPSVPGAHVLVKILGTAMGEKLIFLRYKRRKRCSRRLGHRQKYSRVQVMDIIRS